MVRKIYIGVIPLLLATVMALTMPVLADLMSDERQIDTAARTALAQQAAAGALDGTASVIVPDFSLVQTSDIVIQGTTAFGMIVVRVPDDLHGTPDLRVFIARQTAAGWEVALEYTPTFYEWLAQAPDGLMSLRARRLLLQGAVQNRRDDLDSAQGNGNALLSWPFQFGETWTFVGGPHGNNGDSVRPWTAIDLAVEGVGRVRAARDGVVWRSSACPNFVRVDHSEGWQTGYYHLANEQVVNGQYVERGAWLGNTSSQVGCGGWSSGPHVHFTLRRYGSYLNINGHDIGGWTIEEGTAAYGGCTKRVRDNFRVCRPHGQVYNDGSIGSGDYKERHDLNADAVPDIWAVNMRDAGVNRTSLHVVSGSGLQNTLFSGATGMPQQPAHLNTAFAAGHYNNDRIPDLYVIHRLDGSETTALRVMNGADPRWLLLDTATALPPYDNSVSFAVADYNRDGAPDLWAIHPRDPAKNAVSVRIVSGKSWQTVLVDTATSLPLQSAYSDVNFAAADYNADGFPDLWAIYPRDTERESVSVKIISGRDFTTVLVDREVARAMLSTDITAFGFMVADVNLDFVPDLWVIDRARGNVVVYSGKDFTTVLRSGPTALPNSYGDDWHILGSDRARESLPPLPPVITSPAFGQEINTAGVRLEWQPAPLAREYLIIVSQVGVPGVLVQRRVSAAEVCNARFCRIATAALGVKLLDNQSYRWRVRAINPYGRTVSQNMLIVVDRPGLPTLTVPDGAVFTETPVLTWAGTPQTTLYRLVIRPAGKPILARHNLQAVECPEGLCAFLLPDALADGLYEWRVIARDQINGGSSTTDWRMFSVVMPPDPETTAEAAATPAVP